MINKRIEKLKALAGSLNMDVSIKSIGNNIFANINGCSFKVNSYNQFKSKCLELQNYVAPEPIDLTSRLIKIEENYLNNL